MEASEAPTKRLDSWKEIATYLGKGVTTVQRWEKTEGLPVHRQVHQSLASIFAYTHELDAWRESRKSAAPALDEAKVETPPAPRIGRRAWLGGSLILGAGAATMALIRPRPPAARPLFDKSLSEQAASITGDGRSILYWERDSASSRFRLFDRRTGSVRTLETHPLSAQAGVPRISPDGKLFAYLSLTEGNLWKVWVRDRDSGPAREIARLDGVGISWAPDSQTLALTSRPPEGGPVAVFALHHLLGNWRRVSQPPPASWGDIDVACSPDGDHLAVIRYTTHGDGDVWLLSWDGRVERRLTHLRVWINGLSFTADGRDIVFCPVIEQVGRLYRVSIHGGAPREIPAPGTRGVRMPAAGAGALVFEEHSYLSRLYRGRPAGALIENERPLTALTAGGEYAAHAWHANAVAWTQADGIWLAARGAAPRRVLDFAPEKRNVAWSADGRQLAFVAREAGLWRVFLLDIDSGRMRPLTADRTSEGRPVWPPSGRHIYWRSERSGEPRYYRRRWPDGAQTEPVSPRAAEAIPSADERYLYFTNDDQRSLIHEIAIGAAGAPRVLDHIPPVKPGHWFVHDSDIVYAPTHEPGPTTLIFRAPIAGGKPQLLCRLPVHADGLADLSVSPDLSEVVWARLESAEDIWIVDPFR